MELRQIEHFVAVAEQGSFTAAARVSSIVQSALSTSIRNLERELGATLFERTTRRVTLSEAGRRFLPAARRVLAEAEAAGDAVRGVAELRTGRVAIGMIQWLGPVDVPAELSAFHRRYPGIQISVWNSPVNQLMDRLRAGALDLAYLVSDEPLPEDLVGVTVYREDMVLAMPPDHRLAGRERVRWAELDDEPVVDFAEGSSVTNIVRRVSAQRGLRRRIIGQVTQLDVQLALVRNGLGIAFVQRTLAETARGVRIADLVDPEVVLAISLATRAPGPVNPAAAALLDHLAPTAEAASRGQLAEARTPHPGR
jgi:DNA-binding transcriptional LysR family regulator